MSIGSQGQAKLEEGAARSEVERAHLEAEQAHLEVGRAHLEVGRAHLAVEQAPLEAAPHLGLPEVVQRLDQAAVLAEQARLGP
ncbi:hypothetical protein HK104_002650, partial [Borealophlyctis nickersoniae]